MEIAKKKSTEQAPNFNTYNMELSYGELVTIENALANDHSGVVGDELYRGIRWFLDRLPKPGEEPPEKEKKEGEGDEVDDLLGAPPTDFEPGESDPMQPHGMEGGEEGPMPPHEGPEEPAEDMDKPGSFEEEPELEAPPVKKGKLEKHPAEESLIDSLLPEPIQEEGEEELDHAQRFGYGRPNRQKKTKAFKVASESKNANSFGLHGYVLVAQDGEAWEVGRSKGAWNSPWSKGTVVHAVLDDKTGIPHFRDVEIPRKLPRCPEPVIAEIWAAPADDTLGGIRPD